MGDSARTTGFASTTGPGCEALAGGLLQEPVSAVTSLAFVLAGGAILAATRPRGTAPRRGDGTPGVRAYALLVAAVGVGSWVQHGPDPEWSDLAHDLPLLATLAFVAADALADLTGRPRAWWWWAVPTAAVVPLVVGAPRAGDVAQSVLAAVAVALTLVRARERPALRRRIGASVTVLVTGATIGSLSRAGGPLCDPHSLWQGHAVWHVMAAVALVVLAPVLLPSPQPEGLAVPDHREGVRDLPDEDAVLGVPESEEHPRPG